MEEHGVTLSFVTEKFEDTATGQLLRSVKAFAAEFEREKIAERTMRGKVERARSGRLPQAAGRGMYGYVYNSVVGKRIGTESGGSCSALFGEFADGASIIGLANALNEEGIRRCMEKLGRRPRSSTCCETLVMQDGARLGDSRRRCQGPRYRKEKAEGDRSPQAEWIDVPVRHPLSFQLSFRRCRRGLTTLSVFGMAEVCRPMVSLGE